MVSSALNAKPIAEVFHLDFWTTHTHIHHTSVRHYQFSLRFVLTGCVFIPFENPTSTRVFDVWRKLLGLSISTSIYLNFIDKLSPSPSPSPFTSLKSKGMRPMRLHISKRIQFTPYIIWNANFRRKYWVFWQLNRKTNHTTQPRFTFSYYSVSGKERVRMTTKKVRAKKSSLIPRYGQEKQPSQNPYNFWVFSAILLISRHSPPSTTF